MIIAVYKCEDCPLFYCDMENGYICTSTGTPEDRIKGELIPTDCPLRKDQIIIKLGEYE